MKLYYIANARIPTEKAHGIQIMKMCESFAKMGLDVELIVPDRINHLKSDAFSYYNTKKIFKIKKLFTIDLIRLGRFGFFVQNLTFSLSAFVCSLFRNDNISYTRDELAAFFLSFVSKKVFWEVHEGRFNFFVRQNLKRVAGIVVISDNLKNFLVNKGADKNRIFVARDGVDLKQFTLNESNQSCRLKLNLPMDKKIILYTGHLYEWKGADILAEASKYLDNNFLVLLVGGLERDVNKFKEKYSASNIDFIGWRSYDLMPYYMRAADVLVLPNSGKQDISRFYTSPMKLFEYMASGQPIVASDLPSFKEVLDNDSAILVEPDNPLDLANGIKRAIEDSDLAGRIARKAKLDIIKYSWEARAKNIIAFIKNQI